MSVMCYTYEKAVMQKGYCSCSMTKIIWVISKVMRHFTFIPKRILSLTK